MSAKSARLERRSCRASVWLEAVTEDFRVGILKVLIENEAVICGDLMWVNGSPSKPIESTFIRIGGEVKKPIVNAWKDEGGLTEVGAQQILCELERHQGGSAYGRGEESEVRAPNVA